jgi:hypothetical protein
MKENILKINAYLLLAGALYQLVLLGIQYEDIYSSWYAFFSPQIDITANVVLVCIYAMAIGVPAIMTSAGVLLLKHGSIKWYLATALFVVLILSAVVGKLILLVSICVYVYFRVTRSHITSVAT